MSMKYLKTDTLDIHAGGRDLIFPHHENEIAQAQALTDKPFAKYWIHHGLLTINGQKMAKSLGNFVSIKEALSKYSVDVLKLFYLQAHYSSPLDFSQEIMEQCKGAMERFHIFFDKLDKNKANISRKHLPSSQKLKEKIELAKQGFIAAMDDDFNTPIALSKLYEIVYETNVSLQHNELDKEVADFAQKTIRDLGYVFGLSFKWDNKISPFIEFKIQERNKARQAKDFQKADAIREELLQLGYILEDTEDGKTTWRRKL